MATLAAELTKPDVLGPWADRWPKLEESTFGLLEATKEGRAASTNLIVVVDQFEDYPLVLPRRSRATHEPASAIPTKMMDAGSGVAVTEFASTTSLGKPSGLSRSRKWGPKPPVPV